MNPGKPFLTDGQTLFLLGLRFLSDEGVYLFLGFYIRLYDLSLHGYIHL